MQPNASHDLSVLNAKFKLNLIEHKMTPCGLIIVKKTPKLNINIMFFVVIAL